MNEPQGSVQVLTAGGAGQKKKRNRHKAKEPHAESNPPAATAHESVSVEAQNTQPPTQDEPMGHLEYEQEPTHNGEDDVEDVALNDAQQPPTHSSRNNGLYSDHPPKDLRRRLVPMERKTEASPASSELLWLVVCFLGIMASFVCYGLLLEYTTSGGRKLHELSFLFVTSGLYTLTAAAGRYVRDETPTTIPPARFAILGLTSMGSTWCSVRSLRCVVQLCLTSKKCVRL